MGVGQWQHGSSRLLELSQASAVNRAKRRRAYVWYRLLLVESFDIGKSAKGKTSTQLPCQWRVIQRKSCKSTKCFVGNREKAHDQGPGVAQPAATDSWAIGLEFLLQSQHRGYWLLKGWEASQKAEPNSSSGCWLVKAETKLLSVDHSWSKKTLLDLLTRQEHGSRVSRKSDDWLGPARTVHRRASWWISRAIVGTSYGGLAGLDVSYQASSSSYRFTASKFGPTLITNIWIIDGGQMEQQGDCSNLTFFCSIHFTSVQASTTTFNFFYKACLL